MHKLNSDEPKFLYPQFVGEIVDDILQDDDDLNRVLTFGTDEQKWTDFLKLDYFDYMRYLPNENGIYILNSIIEDFVKYLPYIVRELKYAKENY